MSSRPQTAAAAHALAARDGSTDAASAPAIDTGRLDLLRFLTCGSVDDGKSTLIGRLLYDSQLIFDDQMASLRSDSSKVGTTGDDLDLALLVDGLQAEREQGITIDVAFRYFASPRRKFIVADTPGHEQYTRNMATGASVCELAVILIDARKGVLPQTRRHSSIVHLMDIRHVVVAVNKMDLVDHSQPRFDEIVREYMAFAGKLGLTNVVAIPISARAGDNVINASNAMPWYGGPTLLHYLERVDCSRKSTARPFRLPVQWVNRPSADYRGFAGTIASGSVAPGEEIAVLPSGRTTRVKRIDTFDGPIDRADGGRAVTLVLEDEVDISRGDVISAKADRPEITDQFAADVVWMGDEPMLPGRPYVIKCGTQVVTGSITALKHKLNVNDLDHLAGRDLALNEIGFCNLSLSRPIAFEPYLTNRALGSFIIIDRLSNATVGVGMIRFGLWRATNVHWQALDVGKTERAAAKGQKPCCLWFTGLSGSGKSTVANLMEKRLHADGRHTYILDGDNVRHGLNRDLGFTDVDRVENIRRVAEVARLMVDSGLIVMVSFISPFRAERRLARELMGEGEFLEIFVDTPLEVCEQRDAKGLYQKARQGLIRNFTGIDSAYEPPEHADVRLKGGSAEPDQLVEQLIGALRKRQLI